MNGLGLCPSRSVGCWCPHPAQRAPSPGAWSAALACWSGERQREGDLSLYSGVWTDKLISSTTPNGILASVLLCSLSVVLLIFLRKARSVGAGPCLLAVRVQSKGQRSDLSSAHLASSTDLKQKTTHAEAPKTHSGFSSNQGA